MDFLASPIHNYTYETLDDVFFDLPKEMDFELDGDLRDTITNGDSNDLNDGLYGIWNAKHPWSVNNNSSSIYNSNLHLDFIGGDPESAMMVNPNVVIPSRLQLDHSVKKVSLIDDHNTVDLPSSEDAESYDDNFSTLSSKKLSKLSHTESYSFNELDNAKNSVRVRKSSGIDAQLSSLQAQPKSEHCNARLKNSARNKGDLRTSQFYPKPAFSYSCLIAMALKNSKHGCLPVAEIYNFMCNHFPYFKTAPNGWKNSVRHNLSLNKCFEKFEKPAGSTQRKGCLWALNPEKAAKLEDEVMKCARKDIAAIRRSMEYPEHLELLERGEMKSLYTYDSENETGEFEEEDDETEINERTDVDETPENNDELINGKLSDDDESEEDDEEPLSSPDTDFEDLACSKQNDHGSSWKKPNALGISTSKRLKKYFHINGKSSSESEIYDHYDINNLLKFENETMLTSNNKKSTRFNKRDSSYSKVKQIRFKTFN